MGFMRYLTGVLEIFDACPGDISWVFWGYLISVNEIFDGCNGDIGWVSWR